MIRKRSLGPVLFEITKKVVKVCRTSSCLPALLHVTGPYLKQKCGQQSHFRIFYSWKTILHHIKRVLSFSHRWWCGASCNHRFYAARKIVSSETAPRSLLQEVKFMARATTVDWLQKSHELFLFSFTAPSSVPTSEALLPRRSSRHPPPPTTPRAHFAS